MTLGNKLIDSDASLRIFINRTNFSTVSDALGASPSETHLKGEQTRAGATILDDVWVFTSSTPAKKGFLAQVHAIETKLASRASQVSKITDLQGFKRADVFLAMTIEGERYDFQLPGDTIEVLANAKAGLELSFVFFDTPTLDREQYPVMKEAHLPAQNEEFTTSLRVFADQRIVAKFCKETRLEYKEEPSFSSTTAQAFWISPTTASLARCSEELIGLCARLQENRGAYDQLRKLARVSVLSCFAFSCEWAGFFVSAQALQQLSTLHAALDCMVSLL